MTPLAKQPRYAAAIQELNDLNSALAKVQGRIIEIEALLQAHAPDRDSGHVAAALSFAATGVVKGPDNTPMALREEHMALRQQAEALQNVIRTRSDAVHHLVGELSNEVCREAESQHAELCKQYVKALRVLDAAHQKDFEFRWDIERLGYSANFRDHVQWNHVGRAADRDSMMSSRLREFAAYER